MLRHTPNIVPVADRISVLPGGLPPFLPPHPPQVTIVILFMLIIIPSKPQPLNLYPIPFDPYLLIPIPSDPYPFILIPFNSQPLNIIFILSEPHPRFLNLKSFSSNFLFLFMTSFFWVQESQLCTWVPRMYSRMTLSRVPILHFNPYFLTPYITSIIFNAI
jgi:hypothetical protein